MIKILLLSTGGKFVAVTETGVFVAAGDPESIADILNKQTILLEDGTILTTEDGSPLNYEE